MHYHTTISLAVLTLVSVAASASGLFLPNSNFLRPTSSPLGLPRTNWHHHYGQASQAAAVENAGYPQQGSNGVSAPVSRSGGVSGDHGKDKSCDAPPKASRVDDTVIPKEEKNSQQAAAPIEKASGQAASTRDSTSTDQSSSSTGLSKTRTNNSTVAAGASVSSRKGAGLWYFKDIATMTSDVHATWAYEWSDDPLENSFIGNAPAGVDLVAMFDSKSEYSSLASSAYKEVVGWNEPDAPAAPFNSLAGCRP